MLVRRLRGRGSVGIIEVNGELLFAPGADLSRWKQRFSQKARAFTASSSVSNPNRRPRGRPRWAHQGRPLRSTFSASTTTRITRGGGKFFIAVGSSAPYALYVDQGTGIHGGNGPYPAKILPPWTQGGPSLYEHTWRPGGPGADRVGPVMVKGQRAQEFFDTGVKRAFRAMKLRSVRVPGEPVIPGKTSSLSASFPDGLANKVMGPFSTPAFIAQLEEWRAWRDEAFFAKKPFEKPSPKYARAAARRKAMAEKAERLNGTQGAKIKRPKKNQPAKKATRVPLPIDQRTKASLSAKGFAVKSIVYYTDHTYLAVVIPKGGGRAGTYKGTW